MHKRILTAALALIFGVTASAQTKTGVAAWKEACDSVAVLMEERTSVEMEVKLKSALMKGKNIDLYFTEQLKYYPWRDEEVKWFRAILKELMPEYCKGATIGTIYAKAQTIEQLSDKALTNDGKPYSDKFRYTDYRQQICPLVQEVGKPHFNKGLYGRHIAMWDSHGYYYNKKYDKWMWQRAPLFTTIEDMYTMTYVLPFLAPMLENAGANVMIPRERDVNRVEVVAEAFDNQWRLNIPKRGHYAVYVQYKTTDKSSSKALYTVNHLGGKSEFLVNQKIGGGTLIYLGSFDFAEGNTIVTLENKGEAGTSVSAGRVKIGGGVGVSGMPRYAEGAKYWMEYADVDKTVWHQNSGKDDYRDDFMSRGAWVNWLSAGSVLHPGNYIPPKDGDGKQPEQRKGLGIPVDLALGFHTDAGFEPDDDIVGTLAIYTRICDGKNSFPNGDDRFMNRQLTDAIQTQVVQDIQATMNPEWDRRGLWDKSYSESRTPQVPAVLLELLSHQNFEDMKYGLDPAFRFNVSRAVYKGMLKFLSNRYGCTYMVQPLPVHSFSAILEGSDSIRLTWEATEDPLEPTAVPDRYFLYTRIDDKGFGNPVEVSGTSAIVRIEPGHVYSWKVVAVNDGGMSFPSEILAAGVPASGNTGHSVLVVNNFTRVGGPVWSDTPSYAGFNYAVDGGVPYIQEIGYIGEQYEWRRDRKWKSDDNAGFGSSFTNHAGELIAGNTFDFVAEHGKSILAADHAFCSSSVEAFIDRTPSKLWAVDMICGKQITCRTGKGEAKYTVFTEELRDKVKKLTKEGTNFLISGANIGKDIDDNIWPVEMDPAFVSAGLKFLSETFGVDVITSHATRTANVQAIKSRKSPEIDDNIKDFHFNNVLSPDRYCVETADAFAPSSSKAHSFLRYADSGTSAGVCFNSGSHKSVCLGFPIEIITDDEAINEIISATLRYFEK